MAAKLRFEKLLEDQSYRIRLKYHNQRLDAGCVVHEGFHSNQSAFAKWCRSAQGYASRLRRSNHANRPLIRQRLIEFLDATTIQPNLRDDPYFAFTQSTLFSLAQEGTAGGLSSHPVIAQLIAFQIQNVFQLDAYRCVMLLRTIVLMDLEHGEDAFDAISSRICHTAGELLPNELRDLFNFIGGCPLAFRRKPKIQLMCRLFVEHAEAKAATTPFTLLTQIFASASFADPQLGVRFGESTVMPWLETQMHALQLTADDCASLCRGVARSHFAPRLLMCSVARAVIEQLTLFSPNELGEIVQAYQTVSFRHDELLRNVASEQTKRRIMQTPFGVAATLGALAYFKLDCGSDVCTPLFLAVRQIIDPSIGSRIVHAFGNLGVKNVLVFTEVVSRVARFAKELNVSCVSRTLHGIAKGRAIFDSKVTRVSTMELLRDVLVRTNDELNLVREELSFAVTELTFQTESLEAHNLVGVEEIRLLAKQVLDALASDK